jgi:hypothetical protein
MLTIPGKPQRFCDRVSRRNFLKVGGLAFGGLSVANLLEAETASGIGRSHKAIIMVFLPGGPPHLDMWDLKPDAPSEVRGEFDPIPTNVAGIQICELMPRTAQIMDKLAIIRSVVGVPGDHAAYHCLTGRPRQNAPAGGWPSLGAVLSKLQGPVDPAVPPFVGLAPEMKLKEWADSGAPGFLGNSFAPFKPKGEMLGDMVLDGITSDRLEDRRGLTTAFDRFRRKVDTSDSIAAADAFKQQAFGILSSSRILDALDVSKEDKRVRERYGKGGPKLMPTSTDELDATGDLQHFLIARRLVEAGARCVTLNFGKWDWHAENFRGAKNALPMLDQGLSALVEDLHERGLDKDVSVVVWGEFGRSPNINGSAGRDHWNRVMSAVVAGGGMRTGQVIGETDRLAGEAIERPVHYQQIFATLYRQLGIDVDKTVLKDLNGRPHYLIDHREPIQELL